MGPAPSPDTVVVLVSTNRTDESLEEFLRICVGLLAAGQTLALFEIGDADLTAQEGLSDEAVRHLEALEDAWMRADPSSLRDALARTRRIVRLADASRTGTPVLLSIDDAWLDGSTDDEFLEALTHAGQLLRT